MARTRDSGGRATSALKCSFCGKSQNEVSKLIAGPTVYICDECIELCNDIIAEEMRARRQSRGDPEPPQARRRSRPSSTST